MSNKLPELMTSFWRHTPLLPLLSLFPSFILPFPLPLLLRPPSHLSRFAPNHPFQIRRFTGSNNIYFIQQHPVTFHNTGPPPPLSLSLPPSPLPPSLSLSLSLSLYHPSNNVTDPCNKSSRSSGVGLLNLLLNHLHPTPLPPTKLLLLPHSSSNQQFRDFFYLFFFVCVWERESVCVLSFVSLQYGQEQLLLLLLRLVLCLSSLPLKRWKEVQDAQEEEAVAASSHLPLLFNRRRKGGDSDQRNHQLWTTITTINISNTTKKSNL